MQQPANTAEDIIKIKYTSLGRAGDPIDTRLHHMRQRRILLRNHRLYLHRWGLIYRIHLPRRWCLDPVLLLQDRLESPLLILLLFATRGRTSASASTLSSLTRMREVPLDVPELAATVTSSGISLLYGAPSKWCVLHW